ncbi:MAG TPA: hypothetical protein VFG83_13795 [Kofleriaceae bacterium]|nr:hypothetical protein [Kofleriaceae bacterium]
MKSTALKILIGMLMMLASSCMTDMGDDPDISTVQGEVSCRGGCCGSPYNCRVPDRDLRRGCSGARIRNPVTGDCLWPLADDADRAIYDGKGSIMGHVVSDEVRLNQGIRKKRDGRWLAYAFNTRVRTRDGSTQAFSGWIRQSDLRDTDRLFGYQLDLPNPGHGSYATPWKITGGDPSQYETLFLHGPNGHAYGATDYLIRPYGLVHLTYNVPGFALGGHATDSFAPGAIFHRAQGVRQIKIPLYGPHGYPSRKSLHFAYGYVYDGQSRRYGWIAKEALEAQPVPRENCQAQRSCWAKCDNRQDYHLVTGVTSGCADKARAYCRARDRGAFEDAAWAVCQPH